VCSAFIIVMPFAIHRLTDWSINKKFKIIDYFKI
jgi:hypothetical protein